MKFDYCFLFEIWKLEVWKLDNWKLNTLEFQKWELNNWKPGIWKFENIRTWKLEIWTFENPQHPSTFRLPALHTTTFLRGHNELGGTSAGLLVGDLQDIKHRKLPTIFFRHANCARKMQRNFVDRSRSLQFSGPRLFVVQHFRFSDLEILRFSFANVLRSSGGVAWLQSYSFGVGRKRSPI